ncbi:MAG: hypothetical protein ABSE73_16125 [Planctomycetota bacterium]
MANETPDPEAAPSQPQPPAPTPVNEAPAPAVVPEVAAIPPVEATDAFDEAVAEVAAKVLGHDGNAAADPASAEPLVPPATAEDPGSAGVQTASDAATAEDAGSAGAPPASDAAVTEDAPGPPPESPVEPVLEPIPAGPRARPVSGLAGRRVAGLGRPMHKAPARPSMSTRKVAIICGALILAGAAALIGNSILEGVARSRVADEVQAQIGAAENAFAANDVNAAAELAHQAQETLALHPKLLDPVRVQQWQARSEHFLRTKSEADKLQAIADQAERDVHSARTRLDDMKSLLGPATADNQPLVSKIAELLLEVAKVELKQKQKWLQEDLQQAEALYKEGKIEEAASRSTGIAKRMAEKPEVQDPDLEKRLNVLRKWGELFKQAKEVRLAARSATYAEAKRKLQSQLDALDQNNSDLKPLYQRLAALRDELVQEERHSYKLDDKATAQVKVFAKALAEYDKGVGVGQLEGDGVNITYAGKPMHMGLTHEATGPGLYMEAEGFRFLVEPQDLFGTRASENSPGKPPHVACNLTHVLALGAAMKQAGIGLSDETWSAKEEAPLPSARRLGSDGQEYVFLGDRLYKGQRSEDANSEQQSQADFEEKAEALAAAVEQDAPTPEDIRRVVAAAVRAAYKETPWWDHLPGGFVRKVLNEDYIESNMPGSAERLKKELAAFRAAYARIVLPHERFRGASSQGDEALELRTFEKHAIWKVHNRAADTTTFSIKNPDDERDRLFILYDFPGNPADFPGIGQSKTVRMTHQALGVTATYDMAANKLTCDQAVWDRGVILGSPLIPENVRLFKGFGPPAWCLPPHVLLVDQRGNTKGLVTPYGRLDVQNFNEIAEPAKREAAMNAFLDQMAKVLPTANYLHLYFRYLLEYSLPSPITSRPNLLGCRAHCGGQTAQPTFYTLQRFMGGRAVGDCVDLAELFMSVTRRQGKLSYVMSLPFHGACGWVEKPGQDNQYTFYVIETGPPHFFKDKDLDKVTEKAYRSYDDAKTMHINAKSLGFSFRFAGEFTRSPWALSSRMYVDPVYGEVMERVEGYWYFHFYALGIKTMLEMVEKGDRVPENCIELAGLYTRVREAESAIHWTNEAIKQYTPEQRVARLEEEYRIASVWWQEHDKQKCYGVLKGMAAELKGLERDPRSLDYLNLRLEVMHLLGAIGRPWEGWDAVAHEMLLLKRASRVKFEHAAGLTGVYAKMARQLRAGKQPTPQEQEGLAGIQEVLGWFYEHALFEPQDMFNQIQYKYACAGLWYGGKYGHERLVAELLKGGPFPDPAQPRVHANRADPEAEDWKWIRLALPSYSMAIGDALDPDEPPEKWRREEAVKLTEAMLKAATEASKFGSLYSSEFQLLQDRLKRAFILKDWAEVEAVLKVVQERNWPHLTSGIAETLGFGTRFLTPDEFVVQYKVFAKHIKSRTAYFDAIYAAYQADGIEHAVRASKVALDCWPGDEDMKREAQYLEELARKKLARAKNNHQ